MRLRRFRGVSVTECHAEPCRRIPPAHAMRTRAALDVPIGSLCVVYALDRHTQECASAPLRALAPRHSLLRALALCSLCSGLLLVLLARISCPLWRRSLR